jgi:hypothetical protein
MRTGDYYDGMKVVGSSLPTPKSTPLGTGITEGNHFKRPEAGTKADFCMVRYPDGIVRMQCLNRLNPVAEKAS